MSNQVDYKFLSELEGGSRLTGYVPAASVSRSGVTIATGFDLGQRSEADLARLGLSRTLIIKLKPYLGIIGLDAKQYLAQHPLTINEAETRQIDRAVKAAHIHQLGIKYFSSRHNTRGMHFSCLPAEAQTVIASVSFQYGVNLSFRTPRFWRAVSSQDWQQAVEELDNFGDAYPTRRRREAALLKRALQ